MEAVNNAANDAIILCGETGSGKSTQVHCLFDFNFFVIACISLRRDMVRSRNFGLRRAGYFVFWLIPCESMRALSYYAHHACSSHLALTFLCHTCIQKQVPQFLYEAGYGIGGMIGITQPRRVAVTSTAQRVSFEMTSGIVAAVNDSVNTSDSASAGKKGGKKGEYGCFWMWVYVLGW